MGGARKGKSEPELNYNLRRACNTYLSRSQSYRRNKGLKKRGKGGGEGRARGRARGRGEGKGEGGGGRRERSGLHWGGGVV